jgi:hypothetical protein
MLQKSYITAAEFGLGHEAAKLYGTAAMLERVAAQL